jgi:predicted RNA-binding protein with RPS1 domain
MKTGLVHISHISENRVENVAEVICPNAVVWVKVISLGVFVSLVVTIFIKTTIGEGRQKDFPFDEDH